MSTESIDLKQSLEAGMKTGMKTEPENNSLLAMALDYAARGWAVFPLHAVTDAKCSCRTKTCERPGKHPRTQHGLLDATTDPKRIREWWDKWPDANIGMATGKRSGIVVLDIDDDEGKYGSSTLADLEHQHTPLPVTLTCVTGGGRHLYFIHPGCTVKSTSGVVGSGLDVRGDGGYVILPPSAHYSGTKYRWASADAGIAELPAWLLALMLAQAADTT